MKSSRPFSPPTRPQVEAHLSRFQPRPASRAWTLTLLIAVPVTLLFALAMRDTLLLLLPLLVFLVMLVAAHMRIRRMRALEQQVARMHDQATLRRHADSLRLAWDLLPRASANPALHGRVVANIGYNLDQLRAFDAAIAAYDFLIEHLPPSDPIAVQFRVLRALAQLANDELTDADATLRQLRGVMEQYEGTPITATYRLAVLAQRIHTHHYQQAIAEERELVDELRPLGMQAGYGYAMMALAHHQLAIHTQQPIPEAARHWWRQATLLMPAGVLHHRFPELGVLRDGPHALEPHPTPDFEVLA